MIALFLLYNLCRKMLTLCYVMCTVGTVINEQEQEMKEIDEKDAPDGYVACTPIPDVSGYGSCIGCAFDDEHANCCLPSRGKAKCSMYERKDGRDVIFKREDEMSESLKTALGNLPLALERFQHYKKEAADLHHG